MLGNSIGLYFSFSAQYLPYPRNIFEWVERILHVLIKSVANSYHEAAKARKTVFIRVV
jgi:hypothetical protein